MLPAKNRITQQAQWRRLWRRGNRASSLFFVISSMPNQLSYSRFGISISAKTAKKAVDRNRLKRRWREVVRRLMPQIRPGYDIIFSAKKPALSLSSIEISQRVRALCQRQSLITTIHHAKKDRV